MDEIDRKIVAGLRADARVSLQVLSEKVGLSPSPCARRIRKLETDGVIRGYTARIDEARLGLGFSVFVSVWLEKQIGSQLQVFETRIRAFDEVVDCWLMTGAFDYLLRIAVADLAEFEHFLTERLTEVPGVASLESSIPIRRVKDQNG